MQEKKKDILSEKYSQFDNVIQELIDQKDDIIYAMLHRSAGVDIVISFTPLELPQIDITNHIIVFEKKG